MKKAALWIENTRTSSLHFTCSNCGMRLSMRLEQVVKFNECPKCKYHIKGIIKDCDYNKRGIWRR